MRDLNTWLRAAFFVLALAPAGCGDTEGTAGQGGEGGNDLLPALDQGVRIVLEAEDSDEIEPAMVKETLPAPRPGTQSIHKASGGKCVSVPKDANKERKENPVGKVTLKFEIPKDGTYYIYPRTWWKDGCGNSFGMSVDGGEPISVTDSTYEAWHWIRLSRRGSALPRPFKLKKGKHTLTFVNREDHARLDQVYITDDPYDRPEGVMKKLE
jgi:hypothetical protein